MSRRVVILVIHLYGTGHLARAAMIASGLAQAGFEVTLISGGMPAPIIEDGPYRLVQLPPVRIIGTDYANLLDESGAPIDEAYREQRLTALTAVFQAVRPHALITEHFPFGRGQLAAEFIALIDAARTSQPKCLVLASIRDVLVASPKPERLAQVAHRVETLFDAVLVHGDKKFLPLEKSWPAPPDMAAKLIYTGYVAKTGNHLSTVNGHALVAGGEILVSGGGSAAALPLFEAAIGAAHLSSAARVWRILVGHGVPEARFRDLAQRAAAQPAAARLIVERARRDFPSLLAACGVSVSQGGYNTVIDVLHARRPAVFVPYEEDDATDQTLRTQALADAGLCAICESATLSPVTLLAAIMESLSRGPLPEHAVDLDGVAQTGKILEALLAGAPVSEVAARRDFGRHRQCDQ